VLAGEYEFQVGEQKFKGGPGTFIFGLRGIPHTFKCLGPSPGRIVMILARLAVARQFHRVGLGKHLLRDALLRTLQAADIAGLRVAVVHAKDDVTRRFYEHYHFEPFPSDPLKLALLLKDLRALVATAA
jgi:GNAT superfamily N-acetyltransferase